MPQLTYTNASRPGKTDETWHTRPSPSTTRASAARAGARCSRLAPLFETLAGGGRTHRAILAPALLDDSPALQRRLSHRNPWIDPLSHLQVELLARARAGKEEAREPLLATIAGIAAGMRNTG